jgi:hypothetical protein
MQREKELLTECETGISMERVAVSVLILITIIINYE